ncbi:MAG TPA: galactose-1-phosphate uridylyltransferase [Bryobacteraceae bacterium]|nr:galactose-1-phosphate uridylyltransferase [Bryobacteraceae bacterium]
MPELRQDPATKEWVIIATERMQRPHEFRRAAARPAQPEYDPNCPFCPGLERQTPPELMARRNTGAANEPGWTVRVIPNKFAALVPQGNTERLLLDGFFLQMEGVGYHEVVIETPVHNRCIHRMSPAEVEEILHAYRDRYLGLRRDRRLKLILIFKNHGENAGTSLTHPHSQIVATPVVPAYVRRKCEEAIRYYDATGRCLYVDILKAEVRSGQRVILETDCFLVFHPFASQVPFGTWIVPKRHRPSFGQATIDELRDLATVLKESLSRLAKLLNDPDYNYVIHSAPVDGEDDDYFLWHLEIVPRLTRIAGFEIGSGMRINTACPEETARAMREITA